MSVNTNRSDTYSFSIGGSENLEYEGYDYDFIPTLDNKHMCPICLLALRDPVQTECGHRFCHPCIVRSLRICEKCPVDNVPLTKNQLFQDKYAHREVMDLKVRCKNKGCDHVCELRVIESHEETCAMRKIPCKNHCGLLLLLQDAVYHEENQCPRRPTTCETCGQTYPLSAKEQHKEECKQHQPVKCPHCMHELKQYKLHSHISTECLQAPIKCVFEKVGCSQELPRHDIQKHMEKSTQIHLQYLLSSLNHLTKGKSDINVAVENLVSRIDQLEVKNSPYDSNNSNLELYSQGGMHNGYAHGAGPSQAPGSPGDADEIDEIALIKERNHMEELQRERAAADSEAGPSTLTLSGDVEEKITSLDHHVRELMAKMETQISSVRDLTSKINHVEQRMLQQELRCCNGLYYWRIRDYCTLRQAAAAGEVTVLHSPGFYTSPQGYRMCVRVNLDGVETAQGTHLSLFVHLMKGENDELLPWPFSGVITLTVINQRDLPEERSHISETLQARSNLMAFQKPVSERNQKGYGYIDFFPLSMIESEGFIKNNTLVIKAQVRVDNAPPS